MTTLGGTVLVVDDNAVDRARIRRLLGHGPTLLEAATAREGVETARTCEVDCVLLDNRLPDHDGIDVIADFVSRGVPVLMLTAQGNEAVAVAAMKLGATDYLNKASLDAEQLRRGIVQALERHRLQCELEAKTRILAEREARLRFLLEQLPAITWTIDPNGRLTSLAGAGLAAAGVEESDELVGRPLRDVPIGLPLVLRAHERALQGRTGSEMLEVGAGVYYQAHVAPLRGPTGDIVGSIGVALDVTEARTFERMLRHATKMEALGKLAGGVAHDFNNILSAIVSFGTFAYDALHEQDPVREDIGEVLGAAHRAADLVKQLLSFARQRVSEPQPVDVAATAHGVLPMLRRLVGEDVEVELDIAKSPWPALVDKGELEQVLVNLVVNARDAMPSGGRILVGVCTATLTAELIEARGRALQPGDYVIVSVTDDGEGIAAEVAERIFDPFFTTKGVGEGTGLGLSTVYGIAEQACGAVTYYTELGVGTTFRVYLPRAKSVSQAAAPTVMPVVEGGSERILVVEDDSGVRAVVVRALTSIGYGVVEASGRDEALAALERDAPPELVLTDVIMPGTNGFELAQHIWETWPGLPILFMSGYTERAIRERAQLPEGTVVLEKPIDPHTVARAVARAFGRAS